MKKGQKTTKPPVVPKVSAVFGPLILGKGLFYNDVCQQLYFVDTHSYDVHRFDPRTNEHIIAKIGDLELPLAFVIPIATMANQFIVGAGPKILEITWDGKTESIDQYKELQTIDGSFGCGVNNAIVTPRGSLFIATYSESESGQTEVRKSAILKYKNNEITPVLTELTIPNGMTFSRCGKTFYMVDSFTPSVDAFCYDVQTEELTGREVFFDFVEKQIEGKPYNVMTDGDGRIWVSCCGADLMIRVCQHKRVELLRVKLEASIITSSCFASSFLREMYVTTGRFRLSEEELERYPKSGYFFRLTNLATIKGLPCRAFCPNVKGDSKKEDATEDSKKSE